MTNIEKILIFSLLSSEFEDQPLIFTVPNDYKGTALSESSLSHLSQNTTSFREVQNSLPGSNASLNGQLEFPDASGRAPSNVKKDSKNRKKTCELDSSMTPKTENNNLLDPAFLTSIVMPPSLKLSENLEFHQYHFLTATLSTEKFHFWPQLTSLYMVSKPFKIHLNPTRLKHPYISFAFKKMTPC